jgi:serpin B
MKIAFLISSLLLAISAQAVSLSPLTYVVPANNNVGFTLMKEVSKSEKNTKNIMTSPISMYLALSLAENGAAGATKEQLAEYLGSDMKLKGFNDNNKALQDTLAIEKSAPINEWSPKPPVFGIYNSAWSNSNKSPSGGTFAFSKNYVQEIKDYYNAEIQALDFLNPASADVVNNWAKEKTEGLIPKVIDADALKDMMWVLMNATYLEASWVEPFYTLSDSSAPKFKTLDGAKIEVPMLFTTEYFAHGKTSQLEFIEIPFYGTDIAFYIAVPKTTAQFKKLTGDQAWTEAFWQKIFADIKANGTERGELQMPKFSFDYSVSMQRDETLTKAMGLNFLFEDSASFSEMAAPGSVPTAVGLIKQDTRIELDQYGVKAAAVTTIGGMETTSVEAGPTFKMVVDKPFFFAIGSKGTGALLFVGSVVNPAL